MAQNISTLQLPKQGREEQLRIEEMLAPPVDANLPIPIWGGIECTYNRVADQYFDQMELSGHAHRPDDLNIVAGLGIRTVRIGILWERFEKHTSWDWADQAVQRLRNLTVRPIAGLMHHGSGPAHTNLLDPEFPGQLAAYASSVAQRYPEIDAYTPVNEPNTTARFSGQYGHWYPHHQSRQSYLRALLNQVRATVLSMEAIRRVQPKAQLIQTDDCGNISGTSALESVAELLSTRQWLTFDLLFGLVDRSHAMFEYLRANGIEEGEILWFRDHPCPPQVVGVNYYATSDRQLDQRTWLYPANAGSSEGPFVDVEAVRVEGGAAINFARPIMEAWHRYGQPVALTEVHLGGPATDQIRWLAAAYKGMQDAQRHGVPCEGLTIWALLGSYFWNELVTRDNGYYEPGAFDVRSGIPVPTALAGFIAQLAGGNVPGHLALDEPGWWIRNDRVCYPWAEPASQAA